MTHDLGGRRFLVCHSIVQGYMGSTIVTLDLATYLVGEGADVVVYAAFVDEPAASVFRGRGIVVVDDEGLTDDMLDGLDYVWVNSQVIPELLVDRLAVSPHQSLPRFVFHHMSPLPYAPDEHPYIHQLEERLASVSVFMSTATRDDLRPYFAQELPTAIYPNPAPVEFALTPYLPPKPRAARKVLIVSNHAAPELLEATDLLRAEGLEVRWFGAGRDEYALVTAETLRDVDVVVTIGKTVQYCLVAGRPVFVYDHFGGYGYLTDESIDYAAHRNFSGRGGRCLAAGEIVDELVSGFSAAVDFQAKRRERFVETYSIDHALPRLLGQVTDREIEPFETSYHLVTRSAQVFGARFYRHWGHNVNEVRIREDMTRDLDRLRGELEAARQESEVARREVADVRRSQSYRLGNLLIRPATFLKRLVGRRRTEGDVP